MVARHWRPSGSDVEAQGAELPTLACHWMRHLAVGAGRTGVCRGDEPASCRVTTGGTGAVGIGGSTRGVGDPVRGASSLPRGYPSRVKAVLVEGELGLA